MDREEMTPAEAIERLRNLSDNSDTEMAHVLADEILMAVLQYLGYRDLVDAYDRLDKWYA